jgi:hypothetical protein
MNTGTSAFLNRNTATMMSRKKYHNYTAKQKLLHKLRAGKSYIPDKECGKSTS